MSQDKTTPRRTVRVGDALWDAFTAQAERDGTNASSLIRSEIVRYLNKRGVNTMALIAQDAKPRVTGRSL